MATYYLTYSGYTYKSGEIRSASQGSLTTKESFTLDQDKIVYTWFADNFRAIRIELKGSFSYSPNGALASGKVTDLTTAIKFLGSTEGDGEQITSYKVASKYSDISNYGLLLASGPTLDGNGVASSVNFLYKSDTINNNTAPNPKFPNTYWSNNRNIVNSNSTPLGWWNSPFSTYTITPSKSSINEGETLTTTIETTGVPKGTVVYWKLTGTAADTARFANTSASISNALTGTGTTDSNGKFQIVKSILADNKTQGATQLTVTLYSDAARTQQVGTTGITTVTVNDTSTTPAAITKQISPSNLSDLLGRYGDQLSNADTGTSNIQGGGFGTQWAYYINQATASQYGSVSSRFDSAFKGVTGKSFQEASAAIDPQLKINGSQLAVVQKLPNGLVLGAANAKNEGLIYNPKLGKSYLLPSVGTSQEGTKLWALPQVAYKDDLYAGNSQTVVGGNPKNAILYSYKTDGSLKWLKTFTSGSNLNNTWIGGGHQLTILPNGNVAIAWQGNSVNVGNANAWDSTISILSAADGSLIRAC